MLYVAMLYVLLLCSCIMLYCSHVCCMSLRMLYVLVLCIVFMHSGMEERLCRMPEFKQINQIKSNQIAKCFLYMAENDQLKRLGEVVPGSITDPTLWQVRHCCTSHWKL